MSTQDESGAYYTPSLGFPNYHHHHHHPHHDNQDHLQQHQGYSDQDNALKQCSVKGCTNTLTSEDTNKMCDGCRGRHRIYASTKRARRKLEKAAIVTAAAVPAPSNSGKDLAQEIPFIEHTPQRITWVTASGHSYQDPRLASSSAVPPAWNLAIDSHLFPGDGSPESPHLLSPLMPHHTSTSSELANALTPRQASTPASVIASAGLPIQTATDYNEHCLDASALHLQAPHMSVDSGYDSEDLNNTNEGQQVMAPLQVTAVRDQDMSSDRQMSSETAELNQGISSDEVVDGSTRICSVKGCKTVIPESYEYKMCPSCRTRYRTYGNTKRTKWKAERDAFDREMAHLKTLEDEKRKDKGLKPLDECPEELRAWELIVIDEQVPAVSVNTALPESSSSSPTLMNPPARISSSNGDSLGYQLNDNPLLAAAANTSLPARMCTVSHCHKILPGYYRYKRCEQHRLQNRYHSQLKRVREKEVKAVGAEEEENDKSEQATIAHGIDGAKEAMAGDAEAQNVTSHDQKHFCSAGECHNLLLPTVRWRLCEPCRCIYRRRKNQTRAEQNMAADNIMNTNSQAGTIEASVQETQETNHDISAGAVDPDAEGDIDMGENEDETEPKAAENQQSIVAPMAPPSMPPTSMNSGFSRFHVTIDPENATSSPSALDPTTSTAKLVTLDDPLAFRAYRPKTTPSAIGRILARNPGLSVDAFTEVLQAEGANTGVMTLNQTTATKSIMTPTIPTSAPFVYKAPEKRIASTKRTAGKGKRKATSEKQSTSSSTTPVTPTPTSTPAPAASTSGASDSTASAPPGSYGAYGYSPYPYPYPYYMPSPYGMPPYPYPQAPPPAVSEKTKQKSSSNSSTSAGASTQVPPAVPGYSPYLYPFPPPPPHGYPPPPPPNGYSYMPTRYVPGQQPFNSLPPPGPSGINPYTYHLQPSAVPTPTFTLPTSTAPAPFPKTAAAARERQRTQDTKFNYYHYGAGSSDSPTMPNDVIKKRKKRRKVDPDYLEKFNAQTEAISMSLTMDQARRGGASSSGPTLPSASVASGNSTQPVEAEAPSKPMTSTRLCANQTCHRPLSVDTANTLCNRCRLRFKKRQAKTKKRFKLEPRKSLFVGKTKQAVE